MSTEPKREPLPCVVVMRPRCPHCDSTRIKIRRSVKVDSDTSMRWCTCLNCLGRLTIRVE